MIGREDEGRKTMEVHGIILTNRVLDVVRVHHGNRYRNGGEYGYYEQYVPVFSANTPDIFYPTELLGAYRFYATTAEAPYCPHRGDFSECSPNCRAEFVPVASLPAEIVEAISAGTTWLDLTGHEISVCKLSISGGCIICHPCGHGDCLQEGGDE
jgi:hypothetical protein